MNSFWCVGANIGQRRLGPAQLLLSRTRARARRNPAQVKDDPSSDKSSLEMRVAIRQIVAVSIGAEALEESGALKRSRDKGNDSMCAP